MKWLRVLLYALLGVFLIIIGLLSYVSFALPKADPAPDITVDMSESNVKRGAYLANHVMLCMDCHAQRDWSLYAAPPKVGTMGAGGEVFDESMGFPGKFYSPNITPGKLADWSDGEIYRAITTGVSKDGRALFNVMPYQHYGKMDPEDIKAVIAYIRSLPASDNDPAKSEPAFPFNFIVNTLPQEAQPQKRPDQSNLVAYGEYLVNAAACYDCHTEQEKGTFIGEDFAGGMKFQFPDGRVLQSANITPHENGIGTWSQNQFVQRFMQYRDSSFQEIAVGPNDRQTVMPWLMYAHMDSLDLVAIYQYLQSIEAKDRMVNPFENIEKIASR